MEKGRTSRERIPRLAAPRGAREWGEQAHRTLRPAKPPLPLCKLISTIAGEIVKKRGYFLKF